MKEIKVLLVDDTEDHSLISVLNKNPEFEVVGKTNKFSQALTCAEALKPDVIMINLDFMGKLGIELTQKITKELPDSKILVLTIDTDQHRFYKIIKAGALGYMLRDTEPQLFTEAIRTVARGDAYIQPCLLSKLLAEFRQLTDDSRTVFPDQLGLTQRELEIVGYIARGKSNKNIAEKLFISEKTVKNHVSNILRKMDLEDRTQVAVYAYQNKLISRQ